MDKERIDRLIAAFDKTVPQIERERQGLYDLRKEFVEYFNKEKLASMTLEEYCGKGTGDPNSFIGRLCLSLKELGNVDSQKDYSTFLGVSFSKDGNPILSSKLSNDFAYSSSDSDEEKRKKLEKAFEEVVRKDIVSLYEAGEKYDLKAIEKNSRDDWFKAKFLSTYFDDKFLGIFVLKDLTKDVEELLGEKVPNTSNRFLLREKLVAFKNEDRTGLEHWPWPMDVFATFLNTYISNKDNEPKQNDEHNMDKNKDMISPIQCIFFGTPGSGKSYKVDKEILGGKDKKYIFRTTFHPDTDYASFVGTYKPTMNDQHEIEYQFVPQVFTKAYVSAWNNPTEQIYLVIEEINRGNCAQIFGDLFQLLDRSKDGQSEYPIDADVDLCKFLKANLDGKCTEGIENDKLCLPSNLNILATMNTSDQSLFPMDSAFKRRWDWEFVPSHSDNSNNFNIKLGDKTYKWHDFLRQINERIKKATDSEDKQLGTYFIKGDVDAKQFKSKVMFYLWSEICKEEYGTTHNFFRRKTENDESEFSFNELYDNGAEDAAILIEFMDYLKVPAYTDASEE